MGREGTCGQSGFTEADASTSGSPGLHVPPPHPHPTPALGYAGGVALLPSF